LLLSWVLSIDVSSGHAQLVEPATVDRGERFDIPARNPLEARHVPFVD